MAHQYVTFSLEEQLYAVDITLVNEITEIKDITKIPISKDYMEGVLNLRGKVIPIINLKRKMNIEIKRTSNQILVIEYGDKQIGLIIDHAKDVKVIDDQSIEKLESNIYSKLGSNIKCIIKDAGNQLILIIDIPTMFLSIDENEQLLLA